MLNRYELITLIMKDYNITDQSFREELAKMEDRDLLKSASFFIKFDKGRYTTF